MSSGMSSNEEAKSLSSPSSSSSVISSLNSSVAPKVVEGNGIGRNISASSKVGDIIQESQGASMSASMMNGLFKIQKVVDPLFDQDVHPELWMSWKQKIEVYCRSFGKGYVDTLKSKEIGGAVTVFAVRSKQDVVTCKCTNVEEQQLVVVKKVNHVMCVPMSCVLHAVRPI